MSVGVSVFVKMVLNLVVCASLVVGAAVRVVVYLSLVVGAGRSAEVSVSLHVCLIEIWIDWYG